MYNNIFLCFDQDKVNLHIIIEYVKSFGTKFNLKLAENALIKNYNDNNLYIFIQRIPDKLLENPIKNMILLNIEQLTIPRFIDMIKSVLEKNIKVIDYSPENAKTIKELCNQEVSLLPYQYENEEIYKLSTFVKATTKHYDVVFVGWLSPRRRDIIVSLVKKGIKVLFLQSEWGIKRDFTMSSAKLLLNIHYDKNYNVYEAIRCDRWIFAGMMVVSEDSIDTDCLDTKDLVYFEKYDKLVDKVIDIIKNYDSYYQKFISNHDKTIEDLKKKRSMKKEEFMDIVKL